MHAFFDAMQCDVQPPVQIFTIDQLLTYLRKYTATEEVAAKVEEKGPVEVPQGARIGEARVLQSLGAM